MAGRWTPELRVEETGAGCRLTLSGVTSGQGRTLQEAGDDLVARVVDVAVAARRSGFRFTTAGGPLDFRVVAFLWELGEAVSRGEDVRNLVLGPPGASDDATV